MEGSGDSLALAAIAAEKRNIMKETAMRIAKHEDSSGHNLRDAVGDGLLVEQAREWPDSVKSFAELSAAGVAQRCDKASQHLALIVPSRRRTFTNH